MALCARHHGQRSWILRRRPSRGGLPRRTGSAQRLHREKSVLGGIKGLEIGHALGYGVTIIVEQMVREGQRKAVGEVPVPLVYANAYLRTGLRTRASRPGKRSEVSFCFLFTVGAQEGLLACFREVVSEIRLPPSHAQVLAWLQNGTLAATTRVCVNQISSRCCSS